MSSSLGPAVRLIAKTSKAKNSQTNPQVQLGSLLVTCIVKPGVSTQSEGIRDVTEHGVHISVAAQARDGEANEAVRKLFAKALGVPKSDVEVTKGLRCREKTLKVDNFLTKSTTVEAEIARIRSLLQSSTDAN
ncbi:DUF167-domain-containing protein [Aaosphaeria arxii CBS 175.79]|uniref:DUF167-domain-containing protein n=1 Tax=Aaosphaeria arxii CBS 175.79 TaxID=1450172 RepID=A0A6A5XGR3_9PLEO|nr:DUF167-domain-containing protein [Aaosphaeria arxii CBS 175.79]KAF2012378.1 DUF167-domain-containing protein [Aaosphaeria arxii CBS 175.79]